MPNFPSDNKLGRCNKHTWTQPRSGSGTEEGFTTFKWDKGSESDQQRGQGGFLSRDIFCFVFPHRLYKECCILGIPHYHQKKLLRKKGLRKFTGNDISTPLQTRRRFFLTSRGSCRAVKTNPGRHNCTMHVSESQPRAAPLQHFHTSMLTV
jgi:hypothetical protein